MKIFIILMIGVSSFVNAATLECQTLINLEAVSSSVIETSLNEKVLADKLTQVVSYISEKKNSIFSLEAFIPNQDIRIYSEGSLNKTNETLSLSLWAREMMIDVVCRKID